MDGDHRGRIKLSLELGEVVAAWPFGASLAAAAVWRVMHSGRRRTALNEALHELRRPLQALALASPEPHSQGSAAIRGSVQLAATALERLQREVNGEALRPVRVSLPARPLLDAAVGRWRARAVGGGIALRWQAGEARIEADRCEIAQAIDNLIVNAIEHGGPEIVVAARQRLGRLRVAVIDSGREPRPGRRRQGPAGAIARLSGRARRGHGLRLVRRTAAAHGGEFQLRASASGTEAVLELPLSDPAGSGA